MGSGAVVRKGNGGQGFGSRFEGMGTKSDCCMPWKHCGSCPD